MTRRAWWAGTFAVAVWSLGCGEPTGHAGGAVTLRLEGARPDDAGIVFAFATGVDSVHAAASDLALQSRRTAGRWTVAIVGPLAAGPLVKVWLADPGRVPDVTVRDVAAVTGQLRTDVSRYRLVQVR